nr:immunoglobulin heavy chain junction region [Mus musculus]MBK4185149.1 immunoglobulin heavy chain junction region [Mus musculus]
CTRQLRNYFDYW